MVCVPTAPEGVNNPDAFTPVPLQVPPALFAVNVTALASEQIVVGAVMIEGEAA
jgi:hypothetical protein